MKKLIIFIILIVVFLSGLLLTQERNVIDDGKKIGTIISTAIEFALPRVSKLINLIWPKDKSKKIDKAELEQLLEKAEEKVKKEIKLNMQNEFKKISYIVGELYALKDFIVPSIDSIQYLEEIKNLLSSDSIDSELIKRRWERIKEKIKELRKIDTSPIRYYQIRHALEGIRNINNKSITDIDDYYMMTSDLNSLDKEEILDLKNRLIELYNKFSQIGYTLNYELALLGEEFNEAYEKVFSSASGLRPLHLLVGEEVSFEKWSLTGEFSFEKMFREIRESASKIERN